MVTKRKINFTECIEGIDCCIKNAKRLAEEANIIGNKSPTSTFLLIIAFEELGKAHLLGQTASIISKGKSVNWKKFWGMFTSHKFKQTGLFEMILVGQKLLLDHYQEIKRTDPNLGKIIKSKNCVHKNIVYLHRLIEKIKSGDYEIIKWKNLYVDHPNNKWFVPKRAKVVGFIDSRNIYTYITDLETMKKSLLKKFK